MQHTSRYKPPYADMDRGIRRVVRILFENGIETTESCEGGRGHAFAKPTVRFIGQQADGFRALAVCSIHRIRVTELRRVWSIENGEPVGPYWEMIFPYGGQPAHLQLRSNGTRPIRKAR